ncbi:MAG: hypothetical protein AMXMBFR47_37380 [Planctomycetota bacterium]
MAIQFACAGCRNPIEVDDVFAGKAAQCPYCNRVVTVPMESTLSSDDSVPIARPGTPPPPPPGDYPAQPLPLPPLHVGYTTTLKQKSAATYGNVALFCAATMVVMLGVFFYLVVALYMQLLPPGAMTQPTVFDQAEFEKKLMELVPSKPAIPMTYLGSIFFALGGLIFAIVSLRASRDANWRAWLSLPVCGLWTLCQCGGFLYSMLRGG